ncbi:hypothetical protein ACFL54_07570, partial [Planctomycetota bacterium]
RESHFLKVSSSKSPLNITPWQKPEDDGSDDGDDDGGYEPPPEDDYGGDADDGDPGGEDPPPDDDGGGPSDGDDPVPPGGIPEGPGGPPSTPEPPSGPDIPIPSIDSVPNYDGFDSPTKWHRARKKFFPEWRRGFIERVALTGPDVEEPHVVSVDFKDIEFVSEKLNDFMFEDKFETAIFRFKMYEQINNKIKDSPRDVSEPYERCLDVLQYYFNIQHHDHTTAKNFYKKYQGTLRKRAKKALKIIWNEFQEMDMLAKQEILARRGNAEQYEGSMEKPLRKQFFQIDGRVIPEVERQLKQKIIGFLVLVKYVNEMNARDFNDCSREEEIIQGFKDSQAFHKTICDVLFDVGPPVLPCIDYVLNEFYVEKQSKVSHIHRGSILIKDGYVMADVFHPLMVSPDFESTLIKLATRIHEGYMPETGGKKK